METVPAKSLLSPYRETGWFASNYTVNIYRGCPHACIYCDSKSACYGNDDFSIVRAKENALAVLERELSKKKRRGTILTGAMSVHDRVAFEQCLTDGKTDAGCSAGGNVFPFASGGGYRRSAGVTGVICCLISDVLLRLQHFWLR
ncbi:MAG TPA: hypothetical protein O0X38_07165, partial [Methanocorpusculum sp.]|nr:hypothetical protein [Methanocorpusculum sp.]